MTRTSPIDAEFSKLLSRLPEGLDLDASARSHGALIRRRAVRDGATLLRLAFAYAVCGFSLRGASAWAALGAVARLSDVALLNRLRGAADWLGALVAAILSERMTGAAVAGGERRLRLVDATTLSRPGSAGTDWRVHVGYRLGDAPRIDRIELSDGRGAESLERFAGGPGDITIGDRGYARAGDLAAMRARGADFIVRTGWNAVRLRDGEGAPFDLVGMLARAPERGIAEADVRIAVDRSEKRLVAMRLVVLRLSEAEAAKARRRARKKSRKQGKTPQDKTLIAAGHVLLLTSLDAGRFPAADVLALYRLRWQIELAFKRLKSLLHLDDLPARDPDLARCWIYAKLVAALLLEDMAGVFGDSPPCAGDAAAAHCLGLAAPAPAV